MGMFDTIDLYDPPGVLPAEEPYCFQTKDLTNSLWWYRVTRDGHLRLRREGEEWIRQYDVTGVINVYNVIPLELLDTQTQIVMSPHEKGMQGIWVEYDLTFVAGKLTSIVGGIKREE